MPEPIGNHAQTSATTLIDSERVHKLLSVVRMITLEKNPDRLLWFITQHGAEALQAERGSIFLLDEEHNEVWSKVALGESGVIRFPRGKGIAGESIEKSAIVRIPDAYADPRFNRKVDTETGFHTRNILTIPMINAVGKTIGCYQLINKRGGDFTQIDESFAAAFAAQAAVAIESAQLHQQKDVAISHLEEARLELQSNLKLLNVLYEMEQDSNSLPDLTEFLAAACRKAHKATYGSGAALLVETAPGVWHLFGSIDADQISRSIDDVAAAERYMAAPPPSKSFDWWQPDGRNYLACWLGFRGLQSIILTRPSITITQPQGQAQVRRLALEIFCERADAFTTTDLRFAENIGAKIGSMIEKKILIEQQAQSGRLATIGQLTSTIIHDFKNPLTVMQGFSEIIERGEASTEKIRHYGNVIRTQVLRCRKMTEELLRFARGEKNFTFEQVSLPDFFKEIEIALSVETARLKVALSFTTSYADSVWMDREKMLRLVFNLTNNALEVLHEGDRIKIECDRTEDQMIRITVTDSGPGIPEGIRKTLFDPFVTAGKKGGTGLGLHIAQDIAAGHAGSLSLDETHQGGARFVLIVHPDPRSSCAAAPASAS